MLFMLIFITILLLAFIIYYKLDGSMFLWIMSIFYLSVYLIPTLFIHFKYSVISNNIIFKIDYSGITKIENGEKIFYENSKIEEIVIYGTANRILDSGYREFVFENYFYAEIKLIENDPLIITCLFSSKIDKILSIYFNDKKVKKVKLFYPLIQKH